MKNEVLHKKTNNFCWILTQLYGVKYDYEFLFYLKFISFLIVCWICSMYFSEILGFLVLVHIFKYWQYSTFKYFLQFKLHVFCGKRKHQKLFHTRFPILVRLVGTDQKLEGTVRFQWSATSKLQTKLPLVVEASFEAFTRGRSWRK